MADSGYWGLRYPVDPSPQLPKRPRSDYDLAPGASGLERPNIFPREDDHGGLQPLRDSTSIGASYDRYLQTAQKSSFGSVEADNMSGSRSARSVGGGMLDDNVPFRIPFRDPIMNQVTMGVHDPGARDLEIIAEGRFVNQVPMDRPVVPGRGLSLPPDASDSIFIEGLPHDCTEREVAHIFRPFVGYKETRLVRKVSKRQDGDQIIICFVDFTNAACAMTAMNALQGYKMDERNPDSPILKLKFSRSPCPKPGHGPRRKR